MRKRYADKRLRFYIGDVRDPGSVLAATRGVDYVFDAAVLKQVPACEFHPMEAVKTNILGTDNVLEAAIQNGVKRVVGLSTDKAVYPINAMGISKAMMEKVMVMGRKISFWSSVRSPLFMAFMAGLVRSAPLTSGFRPAMHCCQAAACGRG